MRMQRSVTNTEMASALTEQNTEKHSEDWQALKRASRALAASTPPTLRMECAKVFCAEVVSAYWSHLPSQPRTPLRQTFVPTYELGQEGLTLAISLGKVVSQMSAENAAYAVGSTYAAMLPDTHRAKHGVFYTPPPLVEHLLDAATSAGVDWSSCRVLDPACGGGAFLGPIARRMCVGLQGADRRVALRNLGERIRGFEIDPFAAWLSLVFFDVTLHDALGFSDDGLSPIDVCDSLEREAESSFDLVIGNPPYGRVTLSPKLRTKYKRSLFGHANMYGVFLDLAVRHAKPGGVVAFVTPTSFLCGEYHKNLRTLLVDQAPPVELNLLTERSGVFDDVLQETLLTRLPSSRAA